MVAGPKSPDLKTLNDLSGKRVHVRKASSYYESLQQNAKSEVGAIGVMQLMPSTGEQMKVVDIHATESNIHADTKYMDQLMTTYFGDAAFSEGNPPLFAFASYNCGPGNVAKARKEAAKRGLDPNKWFNNVEIVVARRSAPKRRPTFATFKYYVAYTPTLDARAEAEKARQQVAPAKG